MTSVPKRRVGQIHSKGSLPRIRRGSGPEAWHETNPRSKIMSDLRSSLHKIGDGRSVDLDHISRFFSLIVTSNTSIWTLPIVSVFFACRKTSEKPDISVRGCLSFEPASGATKEATERDLTLYIPIKYILLGALLEGISAILHSTHLHSVISNSTGIFCVRGDTRARRRSK